MHLTLHLTNNCNMSCKYCYVNTENIMTMDEETAYKATDLAFKSVKGAVGIVFFGGEPLLHKDLIYKVIDYGKHLQRKTGRHFYYKVTTNGLLLDKDFIELSLKENIFIALSHDGIKAAHDFNRVDKHGIGTFDALSPKISLLLGYRPYAPVLMTVNPETAMYYAESVCYLYERGFRYIICSMNYAADWSDDDLIILKNQYERLADFYMEKTLLEDKFYLSPFEVKISSHINKHTYCHERCELGKKQLSIGPDGNIYPCVQFVFDDSYIIGDLDKGIDEQKRLELYQKNEKEKESCVDCAVRERCNHYCGCLNRQATGSIDLVSPFLCAHERILLPIADRLAEKLYKNRNAMFIQKHYNDMFPLISMIEDSSKIL